MKKDYLSTEAYKGVRDFYPEDMAIQQYIFDTWSKTAKSFGYERYDASVLEPSDLYRAKGSENAEMVNEQTYTFIDRGDREVTLRPEMTPSVARMIAGKRRELNFPARWFSIPNLYRYERPQRGRLREHWQLNCDMFGSDDISADVESIALAYQTLIDFGATPDMFEILLNDRKEMESLYNGIGIKDEDTITAITRLNDRKKKISDAEYKDELFKIVNDNSLVEKVIAIVNKENDENDLLNKLKEFGITNVKIDRTIARGFNYYTSTVFEIVDTHKDNNRSMLGGGRYDNLTAMFSDDKISGIGFGMGDVTMRNFLEIHNLLPANITKTAPSVTVIPTDIKHNLISQKIANRVRQSGITIASDISDRKLGKKIVAAANKGSEYVIIIGDEEIDTNLFTLKNLNAQTEVKDTVENIIKLLNK
jgi:histidyl-tRNA synthetase